MAKRPIVISQHYIPRSYLKNFGFLVNAKKRKWSLYAMINGGEIERRTTESVCSVDYLYDLPFAEGEEKQFLEHAYEEHADRHFTEITEFVTNDTNCDLTIEMREKLLKSCLSLFYRTPKFVELDQNAFDEIQKLPENEREKAWKVKKTKLLEDSVKNFEALYESKKSCGIGICKAEGEWEFISGDNPVIIRNTERKLVDVLASENIIHIPLTPRYCITIIPSSQPEMANTFARISYDDDSVMGINYDIERLHRTYLLGTKQALEKYVKESVEYKKPASEDHPKIVNLKERTEAALILLNILEGSSGRITDEYRKKFMWYWNNLEGFKDDPNNKRYYKML